MIQAIRRQPCRLQQFQSWCIAVESVVIRLRRMSAEHE